MTPGDTEETCGGLKEAEGRTGGGGGGGGNMKLSFTTLSTIAIQAGQSQIVVSVLKVKTSLTADVHSAHTDHLKNRSVGDIIIIKF